MKRILIPSKHLILIPIEIDLVYMERMLSWIEMMRMKTMTVLPHEEGEEDVGLYDVHASVNSVGIKVWS
jgi:hypothetical protein